jgi:Fur family peroxide stress response transcriptional regulator
MSGNRHPSKGRGLTEHETLLVDRLERRGMRVTPQRLATWNRLRDAPQHVTIHDLFERVAKQMPSTTLRTVYESLHTLEELGLVRLLHLPGGARVEAEPVDHAHGYCERCGTIVNLPARPTHTPSTESFHGRMEVVFGLCDRCFTAATGGGSSGAPPRRPSWGTEPEEW